MNLVLKRLLTLSSTGIGIMSLAASCSMPAIENPLAPILGTDKKQENVDFGILKHDPSVKENGFGKINMLKNGVNGEDVDGLVNTEIAKMYQTGKDSWIAFSWNRGLFMTNDGGRTWERKYLVPLDDKEGTVRDEAIAYNNSFLYRGLIVRNGGQEIFMSGQSPTDKLAKIVKSVDGGKTFKQVYTEVTPDTGIRRIVSDGNKPTTLYAVQNNQLIYSKDNGETWSRWFDTESRVAEMGNFSGNRTYAITESGIIYWLSDNGETTPTATKTYLLSTSQTSSASSLLSEEYVGNAIINEALTGSKFSDSGETLSYIEQSAANPNEFLMIANNNIWINRNGLESGFQKLVLPTIVEPDRLVTAAIDPKLGLQRMLVSVNNKIYETNNYGQSWQTPQSLGLSVPVGNIAVLRFDRNDTKVVYAGLAK